MCCVVALAAGVLLPAQEEDSAEALKPMLESLMEEPPAAVDEWPEWYADYVELNDEEIEDETTESLVQELLNMSVEDEAPVTLLRAAERGDMEMCRALLSAGARPDEQDAEGNSALHIAAGFGELAVCELLLENGADVDSQNEDGRTPLHLCAAQGDAEAVSLLLAAGAEVNACDVQGWTPLHFAAAAGDAPVCRLLLAAGADRSLRDEDGFAPQDIARFYCGDELDEVFAE